MPSIGNAFWTKPSGNVKGMLRIKRATRKYEENVKRRKIRGQKAAWKKRKRGLRGFLSRLFR